MAIIKIALVTGTAALGLIFGSKTPPMKQAPEPYWAKTVPYNPSPQGAEYNPHETISYNINLIRPFRFDASTSSEEWKNIDPPPPVYVPMEPTAPIMAEIELTTTMQNQAPTNEAMSRTDEVSATTDEIVAEAKPDLAAEHDPV